MSTSHLNSPVKSRIVFIIGAGHSGSTLLSMILGAHSQGLALSEITWFDQWVRNNDACSCRQPVQSCPIWSEVIARLAFRRGIDVRNFSDEFPIDLGSVFDRSIPVQRITYLLSIACIRTVPILIWRYLDKFKLFAKLIQNTRNALDFYDCVCEVSGKSILIDSSKSVYRSLCIYLLCPKAVQIIYLTRDGRAVTHSLMKHNGYSANVAALRWRSANLYCQRMIGRIPQEQQIHIRYEELCHEPEFIIRSLCRFIGVTYEPSMLNFRHVEHHLIGGNNMRFRTEPGITKDNSWRKMISEEALTTFEKIGGRLNRKLLGDYLEK